MTITYRQLSEVDPAGWRAAGIAWRGLMAVLARRNAALTTASTRLAGAWSGGAGAAAAAHVAHLAAPLRTAMAAFLEVDQILSAYAAALDRARAVLSVAVSAAAATGVEITREGRATPAPTLSGPDRQAAVAAAGRVQVQLTAALSAAAGADRRASSRLAALTAEAAAGWPASAPLVRPPPGATPARVAHWWRGLTGAERRWLVVNEPAWVGRLDGVPSEARDQANRLLLTERRAELTALRERTTAAHVPRAAISVELRRLDGLLAGLAAVESRLLAETGPRAYLLALDPAGDGRAAVAFGDPDTAANVVSIVPGMLAELSGIGGWLGRAERMAERATTLDPAQATSTILWLDYDAPDFVDDAAGLGAARAAGPALHDHVAGLRATHEGPPAHQTVVGHSYGTVVVGVTAQRYGLAADSVAFLGSPGVGADSARSLGVPTVWSSTASNDVISFAMSPERLLSTFVVGVGAPPGVLPRLLVDDDELWHGADPSGPGFGAQVFAGAPRGHGGYWDADNVALDNLSRIMLGPEHHDDVTRR